MTIKDGYNNKPTHIRFDTESGDVRAAGLWIEQEGLKDLPGVGTKYETLAYATLDELLDLKDELTKAVRKLIK